MALTIAAGGSRPAAATRAAMSARSRLPAETSAQETPTSAPVSGDAILIETRVTNAKRHTGVVLGGSTIGESAFCRGGKHQRRQRRSDDHDTVPLSRRHAQGPIRADAAEPGPGRRVGGRARHRQFRRSARRRLDGGRVQARRSRTAAGRSSPARSASSASGGHGVGAVPKQEYRIAAAGVHLVVLVRRLVVGRNRRPRQGEMIECPICPRSRSSSRPATSCTGPPCPTPPSSPPGPGAGAPGRRDRACGRPFEKE